MKTAMQELIDKIQYSIDVQSGVSLTETQVNTLKTVMLVAENLLEKEKEQMYYYFVKGGEFENIIIYDDFIEQYYNQTYNQNK